MEQTGYSVQKVRYVPPHMRNANNKQEQEQRQNQGYENDTSVYNQGHSNGYYEPRNSYSYDNRRSGGRGGYGGYNKGNYAGGNNYNSGGNYTGGANYSSGSGNRYNNYRGGESYYNGPRFNSLGFHGDTRPNPRIETELFGECKSSGINFDKYDDIPVETSGDNIPDPVLEFRTEELGDKLINNLNLCKYTRPTPVQKYSIPIGLNGRDMMACAQTGSGKTGGFLFPTLATMLRNGPMDLKELIQSSTVGRRRIYPTSLVLAPTRELASQIYEEAKKFCYCTGIAPVVIYGGADVRQQLRELERGCDLLVATPGRLVDLIERGRMSLAGIKFLILDEADRMLDMGFEPQIRRIVEQEDMPLENRQTFMFSATFPKEIQRLASDFLNNYIFLTVGRVGSASKDVKQSVQYVEQHDKEDYLIRFLSQVQEGLILVFVETKRNADYLENTLCREGFPAASIHGDKSQREREYALNSFKTGRTPVLVATDVAARGLDISGVTQVINFDLPSNIDDYVHRIGRTGRVGNVGHALSMMNEKNRNICKDLYELFLENGQEIPSWLDQMCASSSYNRNSSNNNRRRGVGGGNHSNTSNNRFGARDYRKDNYNRPTTSSNTGQRGGYGYPNQYNTTTPSTGYKGFPSNNRVGGTPTNDDNSAW